LVGRDRPPTTRLGGDAGQSALHLVAKDLDFHSAKARAKLFAIRTHIVTVLVKRKTIGTRGKVVPIIETEETVVERKNWAHVFADSSYISDDPVCLQIVGSDLWLPDRHREGFIDKAEHLDDGSIFRLRNELGKGADIVKTALSVGETHDARHPVDGTEFARVVPSVLTTRGIVEVQVDSETVLAGPLDRLENVGP